MSAKSFKMLAVTAGVGLIFGAGLGLPAAADETPTPSPSASQTSDPLANAPVKNRENVKPLQMSPSSFKAGDTVTLSAEGFSAGENVTLTMHDKGSNSKVWETSLGTVDSDGKISKGVVLKSDVPQGNYWLVATDASGNEALAEMWWGQPDKDDDEASPSASPSARETADDSRDSRDDSRDNRDNGDDARDSDDSRDSRDDARDNGDDARDSDDADDNGDDADDNGDDATDNGDDANDDAAGADEPTADPVSSEASDATETLADTGGFALLGAAAGVAALVGGAVMIRRR